MINNVIENSIVPEMPNVIPNEHINVYVPYASTSNPGLAAFYNEHFTVVNGQVKIKPAYIQSILARNFQPKYDDTLVTNDKTIVGAINEVKDTLDEVNISVKDAKDTADNAVAAVPDIYFEVGFKLLLSTCFYNTIKNGDVLINLELNTPDFLVFAVRQFDTEGVPILTKEMVLTNTLPVPSVGDIFLIQPVDGGEPQFGIIAIESGGVTATVTVDDQMSDTSENPVKNKVITKAYGDLSDFVTEQAKQVNEVESIAKGANQALSFGSYDDFIYEFNYLPGDKYKRGQNIYIETLGVPDLWVSGVYDYTSGYVYTSDEDFVQDLLKPIEDGGTGGVQVGYYKLSALETQKVDLTEYYKKEYVDEALAKKVTVSTGNHWIVYGYNGDTKKQTTVGLDYANGANVNNIPRRAGNGAIFIPDSSITNPGSITDGQQAVNKKYVDTKKVDFSNGTIAVANNTMYVASSEIHTLNITYPEGNFICYVLFTTLTDGDISVSLPNTSKFIGGAPVFGNGETIELNICNGIVAWGKVQ